MTEFRFIGSHPETLDGGRTIEPGEFTGPIEVDPEEMPQNAHLLDSGVLVEVPDGTYERENEAKAPEAPHVLKGEELKLRAEELDIEGRSTMTADQLREAVATAEASQNPEEGEQT